MLQPPVCDSGVYPQCKLCRRPMRSQRCCSWCVDAPVVVQRQLPGGSDGRQLRMSLSCSTSLWSMSLLCRWTSGFVQFLDKVFDMPVVYNDSVAADSVHRRSQWTFLSGNRDGYAAFSSGGYCRDEGFFPAFEAIFRAELSASFRSPRWRRVLCHRGLLHNETVARCRH